MALILTELQKKLQEHCLHPHTFFHLCCTFVLGFELNFTQLFFNFNNPILETRISVHPPLPVCNAYGIPSWIMKQVGPESSDQTLISLNGKTKRMAFLAEKKGKIKFSGFWHSVYNFLVLIYRFYFFFFFLQDFWIF